MKYMRKTAGYLGQIIKHRDRKRSKYNPIFEQNTGMQ
jgi:hypothetical protein